MLLFVSFCLAVAPGLPVPLAAGVANHGLNHLPLTLTMCLDGTSIGRGVLPTTSCCEECYAYTQFGQGSSEAGAAAGAALGALCLARSVHLWPKKRVAR